jgi:hypothetical protein
MCLTYMSLSRSRLPYCDISIAGIHNFRTFANKYMCSRIVNRNCISRGEMRLPTLGQAARVDINFIWLAVT